MSAQDVVKTVPFRTHLAYGVKNIVMRDRARVQRLQACQHPNGHCEIGIRRARRARRHEEDPDDEIDPYDEEDSRVAGDGKVYHDMTDGGVSYTMSVGVGDPEHTTQYELIVDTGSSVTWVGNNREYDSSTGEFTGNTIDVTYGSGTFTGDEYLDTVSFGPDLVVEKQSIGVASEGTKGFHDDDGILGLGPAHSHEWSGGKIVHTVIDNLYKQDTISSAKIGIYFSPSSETGAVNGEMAFGGVDHSKITSKINYVLLTVSSPASSHWGIDQTITYGDDDTVILPDSPGMVDTGCTRLKLTTDAYEAYMDATGAVEDEETGWLTITEKQYKNLKSLFFKIGDESYEFTANAQIWPRHLNHVIGGDDDAIYLVIGDYGTEHGPGQTFNNGYSFLKRFYSVYDTENSRVGFATTEYTYEDEN